VLRECLAACRGICHGICCAGDTGAHRPGFQERPEPGLRIPKEFELSADEAIMRKEGDRLVIESAPRRTFHELLAEWAAMEPIEEDFGPIDDPPPEPFEL
jgi:antitoxin VapB